MVSKILDIIIIAGKVVMKIFERKEKAEARDKVITDEMSEAFKNRDGAGIARGINRWWRLRR